MPINCQHILTSNQVEAHKGSEKMTFTMNTCGLLEHMTSLRMGVDSRSCEKCSGEITEALKKRGAHMLKAHMTHWGAKPGAVNMDECLRRMLELTGDKTECQRIVVEAVRQSASADKAKALAEEAKALLVRHGLAQKPS